MSLSLDEIILSCTNIIIWSVIILPCDLVRRFPDFAFSVAAFQLPVIGAASLTSEAC